MKTSLDFNQKYLIEDCKRNWLFNTLHFIYQSIAADERIQQFPITLGMHDWWACREPDRSLKGLPGSPANPFWSISFIHDKMGPELYWVWGCTEDWPTGPSWSFQKMPTLDLCKEEDTKLVYYGDYDWGAMDPLVGTRTFLVQHEQNLIESVLDFVIPHFVATSKEYFASLK